MLINTYSYFVSDIKTVRRTNFSKKIQKLVTVFYFHGLNPLLNHMMHSGYIEPGYESNSTVSVGNKFDTELSSIRP